MSSLRSFRFRELSCCEALEELPEMSLDDVDCIDANAAYFADYMSCFLEHSYSSIQRSLLNILKISLAPDLLTSGGLHWNKPPKNYSTAIVSIGEKVHYLRVVLP